MVAQLLLARELMVASSGDELSIALVFFAWLLWVGVGSTAGGLAVKFFKPPPSAIAWLLIVYGLLIPFSIFWARCQGQLLGFHQGEMIPVGTTLLAALIALGPVSVFTGILFSVLCRSAEDEGGRGGAGIVYSLDTAGSVVGGVTFSLLLVQLLSPTSCAALAGLAVIIAGTFNLSGATRNVVLAVAAVLLISSPFWIARVEKHTRETAWGRNIEFSMESGYGNITVLKDDEQYSIFSNGQFTGAVPDSVFGEYSAHIPLLAHPAPRRVMTIGASATTVSEALKHGIEKIDVVELDPRMQAVRRRLCPDNLKWIYDDPRVDIIVRDPRRFLAKTDRKYDVIIIEADAPRTLQQNRYFTVEFLSLLRARLSESGLAATSVPFTENYMGSAEVALLGSIIATYKQLDAAMPLLIPGPKTFLLWSPGRQLEISAEKAAARFNARGIKSAHFSADSAAYYFDAGRIGFALSQFSDDIMEYSMTDDKMGAAFQWLTSRDDVRPDSDKRPVSVFLHSVFTSTYFRSPAYRIIGSARRIVTGNITIYFLLAAAILFAAGFSGGPGSHVAMSGGVFIVGFTGILVELVLIFHFQTVFGIVYQYLGLLTAAFLGGAAVGGAAGARVARGRGVGAAWSLPAAACGLAVVAAAGYAYTYLSSGSTIFDAAAITFLIFAGGAAPGFIYPCAVSLWNVRKGMTESGAAGFLYAADLFGACTGALLMGTILFPLLGVAGSFRLLLPACLTVFAAFLGPVARLLRTRNG